MPHPDLLTEALDRACRGPAEPFVPSAAILGALEAVRGEDGVWAVVSFPEEPVHEGV